MQHVLLARPAEEELSFLFIGVLHVRFTEDLTKFDFVFKWRPHGNWGERTTVIFFDAARYKDVAKRNIA